MPVDTEVAASLAYRKNADAIWQGKAPEKYTRILPYVNGDRVLEIGAAEGVLALLMAEKCHEVWALEKREDRHSEALRLREKWLKLGRHVQDCIMLQGDITGDVWNHVLKDVDILVAVRVIYHLRDKAQSVIDKAFEASTKRVLLCGNKNRAARHFARTTNDNLGEYNFHASIPGMKKLLIKAGYEIETVIEDGDPIVVGRHPSIKSV